MPLVAKSCKVFEPEEKFMSAKNYWLKNAILSKLERS